jgi:hypothetical protein
MTKRRLAVIAAAAAACSLAAACGSPQVSRAYRAPAANTAVQGLRVVFEEATLAPEKGQSRRQYDVVTPRTQLGNALAERLPLQLREARIEAVVRSMAAPGTGSTADAGALFDPATSAWHTLQIRPVAAKAVCPTEKTCVYFFQLALQLLEPQSSKVAWTATLDQSRYGPIGTPQVVYSHYADEVAKTLLHEVVRRE